MEFTKTGELKKAITAFKKEHEGKDPTVTVTGEFEIYNAAKDHVTVTDVPATKVGLVWLMIPHAKSAESEQKPTWAKPVGTASATVA